MNKKPGIEPTRIGVINSDGERVHEDDPRLADPLNPTSIALPGDHGFNAPTPIPSVSAKPSDEKNPGQLMWLSKSPWEPGSRIEQITTQLRTVSIMNWLLWIELAGIFRQKKDLQRAEVCYIGARYCNLGDKDVAMRWLEVFIANRASIQSQDEIHEEAQMMNAGLELVVNEPARLNHELQTLLWTLERDDVLARAGTPIDVRIRTES